MYSIKVVFAFSFNEDRKNYSRNLVRDNSKFCELCNANTLMHCNVSQNEINGTYGDTGRW